MKFTRYFRAFSFATVVAGAFALLVTGGLGFLMFCGFLLLLPFAWKFEDSKWQLSERAGLVIVILALPVFYLDWRLLADVSDPRERIGVGALVHLIMFLSTVKLFQVKSDRDWVFLYLISFFQVLLAAGLSISPMFLFALMAYMLCTCCTVIAFEIDRASRAVKISDFRLISAPPNRRHSARKRDHSIARTLPIMALALLWLIGILALPLFLVTPRYGSAMASSRYGVAGMTAFSDSVTLGEIGLLKRNSDVVMRVRLEIPVGVPARQLRWRGVALDQFDGKAWKHTRPSPVVIKRKERGGWFQLSSVAPSTRLTKQTVFLEPVDTMYLFAAARVVGLQADDRLPFISLDRDLGMQSSAHDLERIVYTALSDTTEPDVEILRHDELEIPDGMQDYLTLPESLDPRVPALANEIVTRAQAANRYDQASSIESYLRTSFGYSLDLKAGGKDPLSDFLFRVKSGHCEYFATAMAVMLRTRGIPSRIVNGFQMGTYNDTADVFTVTQADAHSWVEAYFPETDTWVTFDPTPADDKADGAAGGSLRRYFGKYTEALQMIWIQYVVAYDKQQQQTLTGSLRQKFAMYVQRISGAATFLKARALQLLRWVKGDQSSRLTSIARVLLALSILLVLALIIYRLVRRVLQMGLSRALWFREHGAQQRATVEFYDRMTRALAARGMQRPTHQTPLEFAATIPDPEAAMITNAYNRVRYGIESLTITELDSIEAWIRKLEETK